MKVKILALLAAVFIVCSALHFIEPTAAASAKKGYQVDKGTTYFMDETDPFPHYYKLVWKTYWYSNNVRTVQTVQYERFSKNAKWKVLATGSITMYKVSKTKMKFIDIDKYKGKTSKWVYYEKTRLDTRNYYWKVFRPGLVNPSPE